MAQAEAERDFLARELSRAVGLGGRDRGVGSAAERGTAGVTRAVDKPWGVSVPDILRWAHTSSRAIRTATYCAYLPDPRVPIVWKL